MHLVLNIQLQEWIETLQFVDMISKLGRHCPKEVMKLVYDLKQVYDVDEVGTS